MNTALEQVFAACPPAELARRLRITVQAVSGWRASGKIPPGRVLAVEAVTGVPRHALRPDFYPPAEAAGE